jgi:hypothetical protein
MMAVILAVGLLFFDLDDTETPSLLGGVVSLMVVLWLGLRVLGLDGSTAERARPSPDVSPATVWLAVAIVMLALGAELGLWLLLIAAGMVAVGVGGLVRELRAERESLERLSAPGD